MANVKELFILSASKLIAKLHLAGMQTVKTKNLINTGIIDYDEGAKPENPGKVDFNLENKEGVYEVGIWKLISYELDPMTKEANDSELKKLMDEKNKLIEKLKKKDPKITDETISKDQEISKKDEEIQKRKEKLGLADKKDNKEDSNEEDQKEKDPKELEKEREELKKNSELFKESEAFKKEAIDELTTYFDNFVGKENVKVKIDNEHIIGPFFISSKIKPGGVKDIEIDDKFEIIPLEGSELEKENKAIMKDVSKKVNSNICFKVKYKLNIDE